MFLAIAAILTGAILLVDLRYPLLPIYGYSGPGNVWTQMLLGVALLSAGLTHFLHRRKST